MPGHGVGLARDESCAGVEGRQRSEGRKGLEPKEFVVAALYALKVG